jgi:hypothetical protein
MAEPNVSKLVSKLRDNTTEFIDQLRKNSEKLEANIADITKGTKDSSSERLNEQIEKLAKVTKKNASKAKPKKK